MEERLEAVYKALTGCNQQGINAARQQVFYFLLFQLGFLFGGGKYKLIRFQAKSGTCTLG